MPPLPILRAVALIGLCLASLDPARAAPPSCVTVAPGQYRNQYRILNNCHGNGYALVRSTNERRRSECDVFRISTNPAMAPEIVSYFGRPPEVLDACGDTPSCRRELQGRKASCS
mgnify:CR=1 FL=1